MTESYVFDTETIVAFLYDEPGHASVANLLNTVFEGNADGSIAKANATEVLYLVARFEGDDDVPTEDSLRIADRDLRAIERRGLSIEPADWRLAGEIKAHGHISFADAHAVALATDTDSTLLVGADDDFDELPVDVTIHRFREESV